MTGRALITGAAGFAGSALQRILQAEGWEVVAATARPESGGIPCDVTRPEEVEDLLEAAGPVTHVFHLAAVAFVPAANADPVNAVRVNLHGTIHLLHALARRGFGGRFLNIGSSDTYGPPASLPITEDHPLNPVNAYSISKAAADQYCGFYSKASALDIVRIRPFNHSGPGQASDFFLSSCARQIAAIELGQAPPVIKVGNLEGKRDFSHVDDVAQAFRLVAERGVPGGVYNVCSGTSVPLRQALDKLVGLSGAEIQVEQDRARMRPTDVPEVLGCNARLRQDCGWRPAHTLEDILQGLLDSWRQRLAANPDDGGPVP